MAPLQQGYARLISFFRKRSLDRELAEELQSHLEMAAEEEIRNGAAPDEARRRALVKLGGVDQTKELHRDTRGIPWMETLLQDLRFSVRTLSRDLGFSSFAILILGLGIGASATVFNVVNTLLLQSLPFERASSLVWVANSGGEGLSDRTVQVGHLEALRKHSQSFEDLAGYFAFYGVGDKKLSGAGEPERLSAVPVTQNFFPLLGVKAQIGRLFVDAECQENGPKAVLLSNGFWARRFRSDPSILGQKLILNGAPVTVVGVLPASFDFGPVFAPGSRFDLYAPFPLSARTNGWGNTMSLVGRLRPGVSLAASQAELSVIARQTSEQNPQWNTFKPRVVPLQEHVSGDQRQALQVLACAVGVVMLIVCANLSNLLLARGAARHKELALRMSLGAGRWRLARQLLTESLLLSCCGGVLGVMLALGGTYLLSHWKGMNVPLLETLRFDGAMIGFCLLAALVTGLVFGIMPAWQTPARVLHSALKESSRGSSEGQGRTGLRGVLVVAEIAFACVLLVGAGLLIHSFVEILRVNLGFDPSRTAAIRIDPSTRFNTQEQFNAYCNEALRLVRAIPGVEAAGLTDTLPLGRNRSWSALPRDRSYKRGEEPSAFVRVTSDEYFRSMGIALLAGRDFQAFDTDKTEPVIIINQSLARTIWPGQDPLGKQLIFGKGDRRVIGVVANVRHLALEKESGSEMYIPIRQTGDFAAVDLVLRSSLGPADLAGAVRRALIPIEPNLATNEFRTLRQIVDRSLSERRFVVLLLGAFASFAVLLAALGIYAVISYGVLRRTQEIGIRMALGESTGGLQWRIVKETLYLAALGIALGSIGAWVLSQFLSSLLFRVEARDPLSFLLMLLLIGGIALLAGYIPARRASRIDPMIALRAN